MTDAERIAHLERELAEEREERRRLARLLELALTPKRSGSAERMARKRARDAETVTSDVTVTREVTSHAPSPLLAGSPPLPAPILPPPISSPHPLFSSSASASATEKQGRKPKAKRTPTGDQRHAPLVEALVKAHAEVKGAPYAFDGGKDARFVTELLAFADQDEATRGDAAGLEVLRRWRIALSWNGFRDCASLADLKRNWNAYARPQDGAPTEPPKPKKFIVL